MLDDRGLRPGAMFADIELIGIPHRVVVSGRGLEAGTFEYRARTAEAAENLDRAALLAKPLTANIPGFARGYSMVNIAIIPPGDITTTSKEPRR